MLTAQSVRTRAELCVSDVFATAPYAMYENSTGPVTESNWSLAGILLMAPFLGINLCEKSEKK